MRVSSCLGEMEKFLRYSAPMRTGRQGLTLDILLCPDGDRSWVPNFQLYGVGRVAPCWRVLYSFCRRVHAGVMFYCTCEHLASNTKSDQERFIQAYFRQSLGSVHYAHEKGQRYAECANG